MQALGERSIDFVLACQAVKMLLSTSLVGVRTSVCMCAYTWPHSHPTSSPPAVFAPRGAPV